MLDHPLVEKWREQFAEGGQRNILYAASNEHRLELAAQEKGRLLARIAELETICGGLTKLYQDTIAVRGLLEKLEARFASEGQEGDRG